MKALVRLSALLVLMMPLVGVAQEKKKYKILYISQSKGFKHGSVDRKKDAPLAPSEISVTEIGKESGLFDVECTQDASILTPEKLKELDAVMFYTTGGLPISKENFAAFEEWLKAGHAMIGTHSATDTFGDFQPYWSLINGTFDGHPWGSGENVTVAVQDPTHVVAKPWPAEFQIKDEIYQYKHYDPKAVHVVYGLNMAKCKTKQPYHVPICWVRDVGKGRLFYTNLGHNEGTWTNPQFREHLLTGIRWALGLEQGSAAPNPEVSYSEQAKAFAFVIGTEMGKNGDEMAAKAERAVKGDVEWGAKLYADIDAYRRSDKKKDADKSKAEKERIFGEIEKK
jgi:type 1 glutamine amidotransferase